MTEVKRQKFDYPINMTPDCRLTVSYIDEEGENHKVLTEAKFGENCSFEGVIIFKDVDPKYGKCFGAMLVEKMV